MAPTFEKWSADFWDELVFVGESLRHDTFTGELGAYRIAIDPSVVGDGGMVRVYRTGSGCTLRGIAFRLTDAPAQLAAAVGSLVAPRGTSSSELLTSMHAHDFVRSVRRAESQAASANHLHAVLLRWADRLLPYLESDPALTVADALERYRAERRSRTR